MHTKLNNFNIILEEKQIDLLFESKAGFLSYFSKKWSLEDEFKAILPFIFDKVKLGFSNMCGDKQPGDLIISGSPEITTFDEGSEHPGFQASYVITDSYAKNNLIPALLKSKKSPFILLNKKYKFIEDTKNLNMHLIIRVSADAHGDLDLSKENLYVRKFSVKNWNGLIYLNLDIKNIDRHYSNVQIGTINTTVDVQEYKPLLNRLQEHLNKKDVQRDGLIVSIGNAISKIFFFFLKKNNANWETIKSKGFGHGKLSFGVPGAKIKCVTNFDKNLKPDITLDNNTYDGNYELDYDGRMYKNKRNRYNHSKTSNEKSGYNKNEQNNKHFDYTDTVKNEEVIKTIMPISLFEKVVLLFDKDPNYEISYDMTDDESWTQAKKNGNVYIPIEQPVSNSSENVCVYIYSNLNVKTIEMQKMYKIFLNIIDWKKNQYKNVYLFDKNSIKPIINISIYDENSNEILSRWYTKENFEKAEPEAYNYLKLRLSNMNPLS